MRRTPLQIAQRRLRRTERLLRQREQEIGEQQRAITTGQLAAGIAHLLNNALTAIMGRADLQLLSPQLGPTMREHADAIVTATQRISAAIAHLSAFAKPNLSEPAHSVVEQVLNDTAVLLRAALPRDLSIHLRSGIDAGSASVPPRVVQLELVVLAMEASGLMTDGGEIHLAAETTALDAARAHALQLKPGRWIQIAMTFRTPAPAVAATLRQLLLLSQFRRNALLPRSIDIASGCTMRWWLPTVSPSDGQQFPPLPLPA